MPLNTSGGVGGLPAWKTILTSTGGPVVASTPNDTFTIAAGSGIVVTGTTLSKTVTISTSSVGTTDLVSYTQFGGF